MSVPQRRSGVCRAETDTAVGEYRAQRGAGGTGARSQPGRMSLLALARAPSGAPPSRGRSSVGTSARPAGRASSGV